MSEVLGKEGLDIFDVVNLQKFKGFFQEEMELITELSEVDKLVGHKDNGVFFISHILYRVELVHKDICPLVHYIIQ